MLKSLSMLKKLHRLFLLSVVALCSSCAATVEWKVDRFNVPVPIVNGKAYPLTDEERRIIGQSFVDFYCSIEA